MRILKGLLVSLKSRMPLIEKPLVLSAAQGGEHQRSSLSFNTGYSAKAHCIGTPSYLPPNRDSLQKPIEGLLKNVEDRPAIGGSSNQKHAEKTEHSLHAAALYKGGYRLHRAQQSFTPSIHIRTGKTQAKTNIFQIMLYLDE